MGSSRAYRLPWYVSVSVPTPPRGSVKHLQSRNELNEQGGGHNFHPPAPLIGLRTYTKRAALRDVPLPPEGPSAARRRRAHARTDLPRRRRLRPRIHVG